jgi:GntR family transcriptional repressor for pyruvate dehydrogenase complex
LAADLDPQPLRRTRLYEEVADRLRAFIDAKQLQPGDRLPSEREIASWLEVSRTSVRQALTALKAVGLVDMRHGGGVYLVRATDEVIPTLALQLSGQYEKLPAIMEVREALETATCRLAARRRSPAELAALRRALDRMSKAIERGEDPAPADALFHDAIAKAAHNELLHDLMLQLRDPIDKTRRASLSRLGRPPRSLEAHRLIFNAIEAQNEDLAADRMREHLRVVADVAYVGRHDQPHR